MATSSRGKTAKQNRTESDAPAIDSPGLIAVISHTHPRVSKGGAEVAAYSLFKGLLALGEPAIFIAACPYGDRHKLGTLPANEVVIFHNPEEYDHFYHIAPPGITEQLIEVLRKRGVTRVNFQHYLNIGINSVRAVAQTLDANCTITFHEYLAICNHHGQMVTRPSRALCKASSPSKCGTCFPEHTSTQFELRRQFFMDALEPLSHYVSPSAFLADRMISWGLPSQKFRVIENGVPTEPPADGGTKRPANRSNWVFGYFGQINPFKGIDIILKCVELLGAEKNLPNITIRLHGNVIGQAPEFAAAFDAMLKKYTFLSHTGPYDNADVIRLMEDCDYILVPSTWWENSPVVIQEAYLAKRPIISSNIGGMAEKIQHNKTGLHFKVGDAADLKKAVLAACDAFLYEKFTASLPAVLNSIDMAELYQEIL